MEILTFSLGTEERVAKALADLKEIIDRGGTDSIAFATVHNDGTIESGWTAGRAGALLGSIQRLAHRVNMAMDD